MSIKIKGPKGINSISVDGVQYDVDKKGNFTLPDGTDPAQLSPIGFAVADAEVDTSAADAAAAKAAADAAAQAEADAKAAADAAAAAANKIA